MWNPFLYPVQKGKRPVRGLNYQKKDLPYPSSIKCQINVSHPNIRDGNRLGLVRVRDNHIRCNSLLPYLVPNPTCYELRICDHFMMVQVGCSSLQAILHFFSSKRYVKYFKKNYDFQT